MDLDLSNMCPGRARMRIMGLFGKHFVGRVSVERQHGIVILRGGATRVLFSGARASPVKRFIGTNGIICRIIKLCGSGKSDKSDSTCVPFDALRAVCGGNSGLGGLVVAAGGLRAVRTGRGFRACCHGILKTGRHFSPASRDTV